MDRFVFAGRGHSPVRGSAAGPAGACLWGGAVCAWTRGADVSLPLPAVRGCHQAYEPTYCSLIYSIRVAAGVEVSSVVYFAATPSSEVPGRQEPLGTLGLGCLMIECC